jgi:hypothetical protein
LPIAERFAPVDQQVFEITGFAVDADGYAAAACSVLRLQMHVHLDTQVCRT